MPGDRQVTQILQSLGNGDTSAVGRLMPLVYEELRQLASQYLRKERRGHTLCTTALVHESYLRLIDQKDLTANSRAHFLAIAAVAIRRILIEYARSRTSLKSGGRGDRITLNEEIGLGAEPGSTDQTIDLIMLDECLKRLAEVNERAAQVVEMRFFSSMTIDEISDVLSVTTRTVDNDWKFARVWLLREISKGS